ncbi:hypothetical protein NPIL_67021, partial [Nephila pilipes]
MGIEDDGTIPPMKFEQVSFSHPITINYTSGSTGAPKGVVHGSSYYRKNGNFRKTFLLVIICNLKEEEETRNAREHRGKKSARTPLEENSGVKEKRRDVSSNVK